MRCGDNLGAERKRLLVEDDDVTSKKKTRFRPVRVNKLIFAPLGGGPLKGALKGGSPSRPFLGAINFLTLYFFNRRLGIGKQDPNAVAEGTNNRKERRAGRCEPVQGTLRPIFPHRACTAL